LKDFEALFYLPRSSLRGKVRVSSRQKKKKKKKKNECKKGLLMYKQKGRRLLISVSDRWLN